MLGVWRLQLLREVARRGTIRAAAEAMSVTPSAVSQQLRILEDEAGMPLLEPHGRLVRLTEAGAMLVEQAEVISQALSTAESELAARRDAITGTLRIAAFPTVARAILPAVISRLGQAHPHLRILLRDTETAESLAALRHDDVDIAVVDEYDPDAVLDPALGWLPLMDDPIFLARPGSGAHPPVVEIASLRDEPWIMDTEAATISAAVTAACRRAGFEPRVRSNCRDYSVIIALVEAGLGVAPLPGLALRDRRIRATVSAFEPPLHRRVLVAVKPERRPHPAVAALLAELKALA
jgi:DNA-binding transcriptional LysR family regulator